MKNYQIRKKCTLCESKNLKNILKLGKTPLANSYTKYKNSKELIFPLNVIICRSCGHSQLKELINPSLMFKDYLYVSGTSPILIKHFKNYFKKIKKSLKLNKSKDKILDIACNDGTFLDFFKKDNFKNVIGIDPAKNLRYLNKKKKIDINTKFFNYKNSFYFKKKYKEFKVITANNVFAHVPNLRDFTMGIKNILAKDGLFIFEVSYLKDVIKKMTFDTIYHEHMSYHTLKPLIKFFKSLHLEVIDFDLIEAQGGSIRIYVGHKGNKINKNKIKKQIISENKNNLFSKKTFLSFSKKISLQKHKIGNLIKDNIKKDKVFIGYGAPAKVTTFCHVFEIGNDEIKFIIDDNNLKQNKFTPGKKIKIIKLNKALNFNFDYIIILAWNFSEAIIKKLKINIKNKKYRIIVPFPKIKLIKS